MTKVAAFFDIDGTIFRNSLMIKHFMKLMTFEVIDPAIWYTRSKRCIWSGKVGLETLKDILRY